MRKNFGLWGGRVQWTMHTDGPAVMSQPEISCYSRFKLHVNGMIKKLVSDVLSHFGVGSSTHKILHVVMVHHRARFSICGYNGWSTDHWYEQISGTGALSLRGRGGFDTLETFPWPDMLSC